MLYYECKGKTLLITQHMSPKYFWRQKENNMAKIRIKNIIVIAVAILMFSSVAFAAPGETETESVGPGMVATPSSYTSVRNIDAEIDKASYEEMAKALRLNINLVNGQIKNYTDYKEMVNEKIVRVQKNVNLDDVPEENILKAKELIKLIPQKTKKEKVVAADESIGNLVKNEEYSKALEKLNSTFLKKQAQLAEIEKTIYIWQQIDLLIE